MLMNRTEHLAEGVTLHLGDCREILPTVPRADAVITDPPYGLGDHWGSGWSAAPMYADAKRWDRTIEPELLAAVVAAGKEAIIWGGNYYGMPPARCWLAYVKPCLPTIRACLDQF
jgi:site-specific DNA-methyltransferase (adenine-specific)